MAHRAGICSGTPGHRPVTFLRTLIHGSMCVYVVGNGLRAVPSAQRPQPNGPERLVERDAVWTGYRSTYRTNSGGWAERHTGRSLRSGRTMCHSTHRHTDSQHKAHPHTTQKDSHPSFSDGCSFYELSLSPVRGPRCCRDTTRRGRKRGRFFRWQWHPGAPGSWFPPARRWTGPRW